MLGAASVPLVDALVPPVPGPALVDALVPLLQAADRFDTGAQVLLQGYELVGAVLGLFVAYQAYRGYRRNDSRPMLFISTGFVLVTGVPVVLFAVFLLVPRIPQIALQAAVQTFEVLGLICIIYALRVNPRE